MTHNTAVTDTGCTITGYAFYTDSGCTSAGTGTSLITFASSTIKITALPAGLTHTTVYFGATTKGLVTVCRRMDIEVCGWETVSLTAAGSATALYQYDYNIGT